MNTWILVIIYGISSWGAGGHRYIDFPDKESCYEALSAMRITGQNQASGEDDEQTIVYCKPAIEER